jgi:hypothetical protein
MDADLQSLQQLDQSVHKSLDDLAAELRRASEAGLTQQREARRPP